jgi:RNA polymerase sigma-70 factor, ECF subfamily
VPDSSADDRELFARLRAGDESAFDALFRAWYAPLVRFANGMLRSEAAAEEVVQDVMLEIWRRRTDLELNSAPNAYLIRATRNRALNSIRRVRLEESREPQVVADQTRVVAATDALLAEEELATAISHAIEELPPRCKEVFLMSRREQLKYGEIAERLGITVKAVEANMGRALRTMREHLAPWLPEGDTL